MLELLVGTKEVYDEGSNLFVQTEGYPLRLEHSLASMSKWEAFFGKPFLGDADKTTEEITWYIKAMSVDGDIPPEVWAKLDNHHIDAINEYIASKQSATWFAEDPNKSNSKEITTSEVIYSWMVSLQIPFECQYWHLNRLITLIRVCTIKQQPEKKMTRREVMARNRALNAQRRASLGTRG